MSKRESEWWNQFEHPAQCKIVPLMREIQTGRVHLKNEDCDQLGCEEVK